MAHTRLAAAVGDGVSAVGERIEWVADVDRFGELAEDWDRLAGRDISPFSCHAWFGAWWRAFGDGRRLMTCLVWRGDELVAALPAFARTGGLQAMANYHTPLLRPLRADAPALRALARAVAGARAGAVTIGALGDADGLQALQRAAGEAGRSVALEPRHPSPVVELTGSFPQYAGTLPRTARRKEKRRRNLEDAGTLRFDPLRRPADLDRELDEAFALEAAGWKGRNGTAMVSRPDTAAFYREIARYFHARSELCLGRIEGEDGLLAFDFTLLHGGRAWLLKMAFDERAAQQSPGVLLTLATIERCFEQGLDAYELLGADERWKRDFATTSRRHVELWAYRRGPSGTLQHAYRQALRPRLARARARLRGTGRAR